jgi:hypothetical protein
LSHHRTVRIALFSTFLGAALTVASPAFAQSETSSTATPRIAATVVNPCTKQYVSIAGTTSLVVRELVDGNGQLTADVTGLTKATGAAFSSAGTKYAMSQSDGVTLLSTSPEAIEVSFMSKVSATGPARGDNWRLTLTIKAAVDQFGRITSASAVPSGTVCIG